MKRGRRFIMAAVIRIACILVLTLVGSVHMMTSGAAASAPFPPPFLNFSNGGNDSFGAGMVDYTTDISDYLNSLIQRTDTDTFGQFYKGGDNIGVIFRAPDTEMSSIVAASFFHNDIITPSPAYTGPCDPKQPYAFEAPVLGVVLGYDGMSTLFNDIDNIQEDDWGWGVFYPTDSNSADKRCFWRQDFGSDGGFDCSPYGGNNYVIYPDGTNPVAEVCSDPKDCLGPGEYGPGNPIAFDFPSSGEGGGGVGCHFDTGDMAAFKINQQDVYESGCDFSDPEYGTKCANLVEDIYCQCNYDLQFEDGFGINWGGWVDQWIYGDVAGIYPDKEYGFNAPGNTQNAPSYYMDQSICWMNNIRDMIGLQNAIWLRRYEWNACASDGLTNPNCEPKVDYFSESSDNPSYWDLNAQRIYWGWNEVPVEQANVQDPLNWDSSVIVLPTGVDSVNFLDEVRQSMIDCQINNQVAQGNIVPGIEHVGDRPGSYILMMKTFFNAENDEDPSGPGNYYSEYQKDFFCEDWESPFGYYKIVYIPKDGDTGACYVDFANGKGSGPNYSFDWATDGFGGVDNNCAGLGGERCFFE